MTILSFKEVWVKKSSWFVIIKEYMKLSEINDIENLNKFITNFKEKYINKKVNKELYQRLIPKMDNTDLLKNLY
ncbi:MULTISPECIES: hypothetical protein [Fusobacterium]|uniref:hypothetical protein n=1 Tax=Fusobacterium TaxID=848 RepID=UPI0003B8439C|nr:hypothetical protein [Fusobacterium nucleatum]ERT36710.1 hypothetical protein HMPREF1766_00975 [Fusobacterium nucleatum CTI-5]